MNRVVRALAGLLVVALWAPAVVAEGRVECTQMKSANVSAPVRYCVMLPPSYDSQPERTYPVLYYLHGLGDNEQALINSGAWGLTEDLLKANQLGEFIVATPFGGSTFYIDSQSGKTKYESFMMNEFLPRIEKKYRIQATRKTRGIAGVSMGGYGALRLAFKYPRKFGSVTAHMPALLEKLPAGMAKSNSPLSGAMGDAFGSPMDAAFFERNNVFTLAKNISKAQLRGMKIYFDVGEEDHFRFDAGAVALHELLKKRGIAHEFHLDPGGHDWRFVMRHLPAAMKVHWSVFSGAVKGQESGVRGK